MCRHVGCVGIYKEFSWRSLLWRRMWRAYTAYTMMNRMIWIEEVERRAFAIPGPQAGSQGERWWELARSQV